MHQQGFCMLRFTRELQARYCLGGMGTLSKWVILSPQGPTPPCPNTPHGVPKYHNVWMKNGLLGKSLQRNGFGVMKCISINLENLKEINTETMLYRIMVGLRNHPKKWQKKVCTFNTNFGRGESHNAAKRCTAEFWALCGWNIKLKVTCGGTFFIFIFCCVYCVVLLYSSSA